MSDINLMTADTFIVIAVFISVLIGLFRGATREILSVLSWFGAVFLTIILFPHTKSIARANISHGLIADFVTVCVLFVIFLTILSLFNYMCSNFVNKSALSGVDKFLGAIFGVLRGVIIVSVVDIMLCQWFVSAENPPSWISESKLRPHIMKVANFLILIMPNSLQDTLVSHMSLLNKENLLRFIQNNAVNAASTSAVKKIVSQEAVPTASELIVDNEESEIKIPQEFLSDPTNLSQEEEAKKLATLTPKEIDTPIKNTIETGANAHKTEKEKLDMQRLLDSTAIDE